MSLLSNKKLYLLNFCAAVILFFAIIIAVLFSLKSCTRHGESITLPDFRGLHVDSLLLFAQQHHLNCKIIDSIYNDTLPIGTVVMQDPYPLSGVKIGRNIYVSIVSSLPETVLMPDVINLSIRQAVSLIYSNNLSVKNIEFQTGFDKNAVQKQLFDGVEIEPSTKLRKNTAITLVASEGDAVASIAVPNLKGLTKKEAVMRIFRNSFNVGHIAGNDLKNDNQVVVAQVPTPSSGTYLPGCKINIRVSSEYNTSTTDAIEVVWDSTMMDDDLLHDGGEFTEDAEEETTIDF
jgi:beta-lactam-binding protein with PASTA domain